MFQCSWRESFCGYRLVAWLLVLLAWNAVPRWSVAENDLDRGVNETRRPQVVCFGDSITRRGFPEILGRMIDAETVNAGVPGNTSSQALRRIEADVLKHDPDIVVVLFGTNDIRVDSDKHVPRTRYAENLCSIVTQCRSLGSRVVLCTPPPIDTTAYFTRHEKAVFDRAGGLNKLHGDYRQSVIDIAKEENVAVVDLSTLLLADDGWLSRDGVHPSEHGSEMIAKHVAAVVQNLFSDRAR
ncbi:MAG: SGNH/GDSL hydrolase family protein [Rhodopirellula sp. JB044]|uniref:SGNH/GDSL hydrolase family protein n=1 Tax=Rhodopirellula sp. JB044 TaxID=3342844 RepID=UPI00370A0680